MNNLNKNNLKNYINQNYVKKIYFFWQKPT